MAGIHLHNLWKSFAVAGKEISVLCGLELTLDFSCITVVLGRSGCGKTTLLRMIAGLERCDEGSISLESSKDGSAEKRQDSYAGADASGFGLRLGMVFQEPRLMPWLTVWDNIIFGLKKVRGEESRIHRLFSLTGLEGYEKAYPHQLSGGMQQRAALARALACEPEYLLMDEPFAALDYFTRKAMQEELLRIRQEHGEGVLFVTHSIDEALALGQELVVLEDGVCKAGFDLKEYAYPRDLLSPDMIKAKKEIMEMLL